MTSIDLGDVLVNCQKKVSVLTFFLSVQMIDTVTGREVQPFAVQLKALLDVESRYQPKLSGLRLIEGSQDNGLRMTTRLRELEVKDLLSLTRFFGFCSETFSLAISLLDRFLSVMKVCTQPSWVTVFTLLCSFLKYILKKSSWLLFLWQIQPKHLSCVGLCCFYIAVKSSEEEKNVPLANDLIRISQNKFTVSDMIRMEKIIMEKLFWKVKAPTALRFLRLFHSHIQEQLDAERYGLSRQTEGLCHN